MAATAKGPTGVIRWGYREVAALGPWTVTMTPTETSLSASLLSVDDFGVTQQPLKFVSTTGPDWSWTIVSLQMAGTTLTATLVPME